jgi:NAD(P)H-dependent FMN reductase
VESTLSVGIIVASVREGRRGEAFGKWIHELIDERPNITSELLDLSEWPLPAYSSRDNPMAAEKSYAPGTLERRWADRISALDGFVIVTPEYSHGYPGALKNALDHLYVAWNYKPVGFISYGGFAAGARAVEQLRLVAIELRMVPIRDEVNLRLIGLSVDDHSFPSDELYSKRLAAMIDELLWWTQIMKEARGRRR